MARALLYERLERDEEKEVVKYAKACGIWTGKFVSPGTVGVPDRVFIKYGHVIFIEMKRRGEEPRPIQTKRMKEMRRHGTHCYWFDNAKSAIEQLQLVYGIPEIKTGSAYAKRSTPAGGYAQIPGGGRLIHQERKKVRPVHRYGAR